MAWVVDLTDIEEPLDGREMMRRALQRLYEPRAAHVDVGWEVWAKLGKQPILRVTSLQDMRIAIDLGSSEYLDYHRKTLYGFKVEVVR